VNEHPRKLLDELQQRARKRFGQNFLTRPELGRAIVRGAGVQPGDRVVEVGPGLGLLTRALLDAGAEVLAIELDRDLAAFLVERMPEITLVQGDALRQDWDALCAGGGFRVVANLPYNIGTRLVVDLVKLPHLFTSITVMLQREVVDRMLAEPGTRSYGALTVQVRARAKVRPIIPVPPEAFHPRPKVQSMVVRLDPFDTPHVGTVSPAEFDKVVRAAFSQRRKKVINSLAPTYGKVAAGEALDKAGIDPNLRAEALSLEDFVRLAGTLLGVSSAPD
jgi:16S rRNA (adenine1518-N6/adenine1519-N6)-dimethyltransferase